MLSRKFMLQLLETTAFFITRKKRFEVKVAHINIVTYQKISNFVFLLLDLKCILKQKQQSGLSISNLRHCSNCGKQFLNMV